MDRFSRSYLRMRRATRSLRTMGSEYKRLWRAWGDWCRRNGMRVDCPLFGMNP